MANTALIDQIIAAIRNNGINIITGDILQKQLVDIVNAHDTDVEQLQTIIGALAEGTPKGSYATLSALSDAHPTGAEGIYVVTANGHWYYWNGSAWADGGAYQTALSIVQTIGSSITDVMSQKAVSDQVAKFDNNIVNVGHIFAMTQGKDVVTGNNSTFSGAGDWVTGLGSPAFDINATVAGKLYLNLTTGVNQAIKLPDVLVVGKRYNVSIKARLKAGNGACVIRIGMFTSVNSDSSMRISPTAIEQTYIGTITATNAILYLGAIDAENDGSEYEFDDIIFKEVFEVTEESSNALLAPKVNVSMDNIAELFGAIEGKEMVKGNNSTFDGAGDWVAALGAPGFDINNTVPGKLYFNFTPSENQCIKIPDILTVGKRYNISIKARLRAGAGACVIRIGEFSSSNTEGAFRISPTGAEMTFFGSIVANYPILYLGALGTENDGSEYEFDDIIVKEAYQVSKEVFGTEQFLQSLSKYDKPLTKIGIVGDSLMANDTGGAIPVNLDEGATMRPHRLNYNTIARRLYDLLSWNKPTHRRSDHADWVKSGYWPGVSEGLFEGGEEAYSHSSESGAYVEITVPNGKENFAIICHRDAGMGILNVTLNGGSIAAYGPVSIDLDRTKTGGESDNGNPYHTVVYSNLPAGNNVIRFAKEANTELVRIWGGFYWSGNTLVVHNTAHGGHTLQDLYEQHLQAEVVENDFDAILFELPLMNEAGHGAGVASAQESLETILKNVIGNKDVCFISCHPFGTDPRDGTPNYYTTYPSPSMEDYNGGLKRVLYVNDKPFVDVFSFFKKKIENRGGTLAGGEGGLWYTIDGQHQNEAGMLEFWNTLRFLFENKPIRF